MIGEHSLTSRSGSSANEDKVRPAGKMPTKPLSCDILIEIWRQKLNGEKKIISGETRKWLRCKIKQLDKKLTKH